MVILGARWKYWSEMEVLGRNGDIVVEFDLLG
jgi:hypothetical protein